MELSSDNNNEIVKWFINAQIPKGKEYNFDEIKTNFEKFFDKEENKILIKYSSILEKANYLYKCMVNGEVFAVSDWIPSQLKLFIADFTFHKSNPGKPLPETVRTGQKYVPEKYDNRPVNHKRQNNNSYFSKHPRRYGRETGPRIYMKGHYHQEVPTDEFGCVVVCSSDE